MNHPRMGILGFALVAFTASWCIGASSCNNDTATSNELTILHTNDIHSHYKATVPGSEDNPFGLGGLARIKTLVDQVRGQKKNVILLDGGDWSEGTPHFALDTGSSMLELMQAIGYDGAVVGNHDFLNGPIELSNTIERSGARFPILGANRSVSALSAAEQARFARNVKEYSVVNVGGIRVGLIGLLCDDVVYYPFFKPAQVTNSFEKAAALAKKLRNENLADVIVVLSHNRFEKEKTWAKTIPWVNVIVSGHSHMKISEPFTTTNGGQPAYLVEAQEWGFFVGEMTLTVDVKNKTAKLKSYKVHPINESIAEDPTIAKLIDDKEKLVTQKYQAKLGRNIFTDRIATAEGIYQHDTERETTLGNLLVDSYRDYLQADVAFEISALIGGGFKDTVTIENLFDAQPHIYSPTTDKTWTLQRLSLTGGDLKTILNVGFLAQTVGIPLGWIPTSGTQVVYSLSNGGNAVQSVKIMNRATGAYEALRENAVYTAVFPKGVLIALSEVFGRLGINVNLGTAQDTGVEAWQALVDYASRKQILKYSDYETGSRAFSKEADLAITADWIELDKVSTGFYKVKVRVQNIGQVASNAARIQMLRSATSDYVRDHTETAESISLASPLAVPALAAGASQTFELNWPTGLPQGDYSIRATLQSATGTALSDGNKYNNLAIRHFKVL